MNIIKYKNIYILISLTLIILSMISLLVFRLNFSIDFTGGSKITYDVTVNSSQNIFDETTIIERVKDVFQTTGVDIVDISFKSNSLYLTTRTFDENKLTEIDLYLNTYKDYTYTKTSFELVGAVLGYETIKKSIIALFISFVGIILYISYAFRNIPTPYKSYKFGASALLAMIHDVLIVFGIFSILSEFYGIEIDLLFITALLTVIGFSVNDTIVVFDRIRENMLHFKKGKSFEEIVGLSISETLRRSIATSFTVLLILFCLFLFGGITIKYFILALLIGILSGAYSSIFVASPILVYWEKTK